MTSNDYPKEFIEPQYIQCIPEKNIHYWIYWLRGPGPGPSGYAKCAICGKVRDDG